LCLALALALTSLAPQAQPRPLRFVTHGIKQGLSEATVRCVVEDPDGFMWLGTSDGLNRFDGYDFVIYRNRLADPTSLSHNATTCLLVDRTRTLWVGTNHGLNRYDRERDAFVQYRSAATDPATLSNDLITALHEDTHGNLWVGTFWGLNRYDRERDRFIRYSLAGPDADLAQGGPHVMALLSDSRGNLWVGTATDRLSRFDPQTQSFVSVLEGDIRAICEDRDQTLWVGTQEGLWHFDPATGRLARYTHDPDDPGSLSSNHVDVICEDTRGDLWIGTDGGGLNRLDRGTSRFHAYRHRQHDPSSLGSDVVRTIFEDSRGDLWIGLYTGGVSYHNRHSESFAHYAHIPEEPNSLGHNTVLSLLEDPSGVLWVGTEGGLDRFDRATGQVTHYRHDPANPQTLGANAVLCIYRDARNRLWLGTWAGGLNRWNDAEQTFTRHQPRAGDPHSISSPHVWGITEDSEGLLWLATFGGLNRFDPETERFTRYQHHPNDPASLAHSITRHVLRDRQHRLWVATEDGLSRLDLTRGTFENFRHDPGNPASLTDSAITTLFEDSRGQLWIGTKTGGLNQFDPDRGTARSYRRQDGLPSDYINAILEDAGGFLWISTYGGISRFDPATGTVRNYDESDGLLASQYTRNAAWQNRHGELFFGGQNGFSAFFPDRIDDAAPPPRVVLTDFLVFNRSVDHRKPGSPLTRSISTATEIRLRHNHSVITFAYAALNFRSPGRNRYAYRLEPFDKEWNEVGSERRATYTNLDPGQYDFRVKANSGGLWNDDALSIRVLIQPPLWATWWFRSSGLALLALLLVSLHLLRTRTVRAHNRALQAEISERKRAEAEKARLEDQLRQAQKMEAVGRLAGGIAHDFNNILTAISGYSDMVLAELRPEHPLHADVVEIQQAAKRAASLTSQLLAFSRRQLIRPRVLDLGQVVSLSEPMLRRLIGEHIAMQLRFDPDLWKIKSDPGQIDQILVNLAVNSRDAMRDGGHLTIEVRNANIDEAFCKAHPEGVPGEYVMLSVSDDGSGIDSDALQHLFEPFFTTKPQGKGTGLGLSTVYGIVKQNRGFVNVYSEVGLGSTFKVYFPRTRETAEPASPPAPRPTVPSRETILLVEDEDTVRRLAKRLLERQGYTVLEAAGGQAACRLADEWGADFHLLLTDVVMPGMSGRELHRTLAAKRPGLRVLFMSGYTDDAIAHHGVLKEGTSLLQKPFTADSLNRKVREVLDAPA